MNIVALIVEDHPLYSDALRLLTQEVVGPEAGVLTVTSAEEGLRLAENIESLRLVLLDPGLPGLRGPQAISAFRRLLPGAALIAISASEDRREAQAAFHAGAVAFVSKATTTAPLTDLLRRAIAGQVDTPEWLTPKETTGQAVSGGLTLRQFEVLGALLQGHSNKEIALRLGLAEVTVKIHVSAIFRHFGVVNRTQAVITAARLGLDARTLRSAEEAGQAGA